MNLSMVVGNSGVLAELPRVCVFGGRRSNKKPEIISPFPVPLFYEKINQVIKQIMLTKLNDLDSNEWPKPLLTSTVFAGKNVNMVR